MSHPNPIQIQKFLKGVDYPASKQDLLANAKNLGADENICSSLEQLPDEDFKTPAAVSHAIGQLSDEPSRSTSSSGSNEFLTQAAQDSFAEIALSKLALEKSANDEIKQFAQQMIDDHGKLCQQLERLCHNKNLPFPKDAGKEHQSKIQQMSKLSGEKFDQKFIQQNVKDHENDIKVFNHYAEKAGDADVQKLAKHAVKVLSGHLDMARQMSSKQG